MDKQLDQTSSYKKTKTQNLPHPEVNNCNPTCYTPYYFTKNKYISLFEIVIIFCLYLAFLAMPLINYYSIFQDYKSTLKFLQTCAKNLYEFLTSFHKNR